MKLRDLALSKTMREELQKQLEFSDAEMDKLADAIASGRATAFHTRADYYKAAGIKYKLVLEGPVAHRI